MGLFSLPIAVAVAHLLAGFPSAAAVGLQDHPVVGTSRNVMLSGERGAASWTLSAPAADGEGCDTVADTDLNTTKVIVTVHATDAGACCAAYRAMTGWCSSPGTCRSPTTLYCRRWATRSRSSNRSPGCLDIFGNDLLVALGSAFPFLVTGYVSIYNNTVLPSLGSAFHGHVTMTAMTTGHRTV